MFRWIILLLLPLTILITGYKSLSGHETVSLSDESCSIEEINKSVAPKKKETVAKENATDVMNILGSGSEAQTCQ